MSDAFSRYVEAATGLTKVTKATAEGIVRNLVEQGQLAASNPQELVEGLLERSQENRETLANIVRSETERAVRRMGLATRNDVERLQRQVGDLRRKLREAEEGGTQDAAGTAATKKAATRKAATKKAARTTAKKATKRSGGGGAP